MNEPILTSDETQDEPLSLTYELDMLRQHKADDQAEAAQDWTDGNYGPSYFDYSQPH
jgi:hypothetical protein